MCVCVQATAVAVAMAVKFLLRRGAVRVKTISHIVPNLHTHTNVHKHTQKRVFVCGQTFLRRCGVGGGGDGDARRQC